MVLNQEDGHVAVLNSQSMLWSRSHIEKAVILRLQTFAHEFSRVFKCSADDNLEAQARKDLSTLDGSIVHEGRPYAFVLCPYAFVA